MLAIADRDGVVEASLPGLADAARVSPEECRQALDALESPDEHSRSKDHDGRRVLPVDGGWLLINFAKYRDKMRADERREATAARVRKHRENRASNAEVLQPVTRARAGAPAYARDPAPAPAPAPETDHLSTPPTPSSRAPAPAHARAPESGGGGGSNGSSERIPEDRETICPLDLVERAKAVGIPAEFAKHFHTSPESVLEQIDEFVSHWTFGAGAGERRSHWMRQLRRRLKELGEQNRFRPPGALEHETLSEREKKEIEGFKAARRKLDAEQGKGKR